MGHMKLTTYLYLGLESVELYVHACVMLRCKANWPYQFITFYWSDTVLQMKLMRLKNELIY
jgi:hypothetical protein